MNEQNQRDSIMSMARGAFEERVDYEMDKVIQNILDPNTKATAKRKITLTIELTPDDERRTIGVSVTAKSTLAATNPVATALYVTSDGNGELVVAEMVPQGARPNEHGRHAAGGPEAPEARPARINTHNTEQGGQHNARKNDRQNRQPEGDQDLRD